MLRKPIIIHADPDYKQVKKDKEKSNENLSDNEPTFLKFLVLGDADVGKSCLILRHADDTYTDKHISTIGVDFKMKTQTTEERQEIKTQIWDLSPQSRFNLNIPNYSRAHAILLVFDLTDKNSLDKLRDRLGEIDRFALEKTPVILVGAKCDNRVVTTEEVATWMQNHPNDRIKGCVETSAKTGQNVDKAFDIAIKAALEASYQKLKKNEISGVKEAKRQKLIDALDNYITRIEKHKDSTNQPNFAYGFWHHKNSRAINREANYLLAKELQSELRSSNKDIESIFNGANQTRDIIIGKNGLFMKDDYTKRSINSRELNKIINLAKESTTKSKKKSR